MNLQPTGKNLLLRAVTESEAQGESAIVRVGSSLPEFVVVKLGPHIGGTFYEGDRVIVKEKRSDSWRMIRDGDSEYFTADEGDIVAKHVAGG